MTPGDRRSGDGARVVLVRPNYRSHLITPPIHLGYLASHLKARGVRTRIVDALNLGLDEASVLRTCGDADVVGVTCLSAYFREVVGLVRELKALGKTVVIGGPHASALPAATLETTGADYVVVGEGEQTLFELVERLSAGRPASDLPGVWAAGASGFVHRDLIEDLDSLALPDWDQIDPREYRWAPHGGLVRAFPVAPLITTRGCSFRCKFCASPRLWSHRIRFRSPERVLDEAELLVKKYQVRELHFIDDNITARKSHILAICNGLIRRKLNVHWALPNGMRVEGVNPEILLKMRQSGCYSVALGIESGAQSVLDACDKRLDLERVEETVRQAKDVGLVTQGFFIFGLPGETPETMKQTLGLALRLPLDKAQFLIFDLLPGSRYWDELQSERRTTAWNYRSFQEPVWVPPGLTYEALKRMQSVAFCRFFARPRPLRYVLRYLKVRQLPYVWQRAKDFVLPVRDA